MTDATPWDDLEASFAWTPGEQADIGQRAGQLRADVVASTGVVKHEHNADRTRENGWAYWRCTGCGQLCHHVPAPPVPEVYAYCPCCTTAGTMPCLACGDPCLPAEHLEHIRTKHPACPDCHIIEGSALGTGCTCAKT